MTAISLVAQAGAAYLLTDGALYDDDGIVRAIASKVLVAEEERLAIAPSGRCTSVDLQVALDARGIARQAEIMGALPAIARARRDASEAAGLSEPDLQLFVALWSETANEAQAWMLSTNAMAHWGPCTPCTWIRVDAMIGTARPLADVLGRPDADAMLIDMEVDGLAIINDQRATGWPDGRYYVGGHGELVTVTAGGVTQRRLVEWPDRVGERITQ